MRNVIIILLVLFGLQGMAQTIPQINNVPWYEFNRKLSVKERLIIPLDTTSLPAGATVRDTSGLLAIKGTTLYFLYNGRWINVSSASIDSSIFATVYRLDTAKANLRASIATKVNISDTSAMLAKYFNQAIRSGDSIIFYNSGVRLAGVYSPAPTYANGTEIESGVVKLSDGSTQLTEPVVLNGTTAGQSISLVAGNILSLEGVNSVRVAGRNSPPPTDSGYISYSAIQPRWSHNVTQVDGNTSVPLNSMGLQLPTISADRTITFPYRPSSIRPFFYLLNDNTSAFNWVVAGAPVEDGAGNAIVNLQSGLSLFMWNGSKWIRQAGGSSGGSGTVTNIATNTATGITGGPITTTGTLAIDTNLLKTHASHKKAIDSLGALISAPNLIVQNIGTGQQTWFASGDTLYKKRIDSTYALTWTTKTDSTLQANIDTARIATRAWVVGQGYGSGSGSGWALTGNSISGADSVFGTTSNNGVKLISNNLTVGAFTRQGQLLLGSVTPFHENTSALNISGSMTMTDTISIRKGTNAAFQLYSSGAGSAAIRTFNNATLTFNGDVISATKLYGTTYMQSPLYYGTSTLNLQTANSSSNNNFTIMNMTNINPGENSGTGYSRLVSMNKLIRRGTQDGTETVLRLDYTLTGTATDIRALDVVKGRTILTSLQTAVAAKTTAYAIGEDDYTITGDATSAAFSVTLPTAVGRAGKIHVIKKIDASANVVTVATTSSQTIDGATTYTALSAQWKYVTVQSDGANWIIIGNN